MRMKVRAGVSLIKRSVEKRLAKVKRVQKIERVLHKVAKTDCNYSRSQAEAV